MPTKQTKHDVILFDISKYTKTIKQKIDDIMKMNKKIKKLNDVLLNKYIKNHENEMMNSLTIKRLQMKIGNIWQVANKQFSFQEIMMDSKI